MGKAGHSKKHKQKRKHRFKERLLAVEKKAVSEKQKQIDEAVEREDAHALGLLCCSEGGLLSDENRTKAWPIMLKNARYGEPVATQNRSRKREEVEAECNMDILRSMYHFSCCKELRDDQRDAERLRLMNLIYRVFSSTPSLYYYQGFHDVCTVTLHVFSKDRSKAADVAREISLQYFRDHHQKDFSTTIKVMDLIMVVLRHFDKNTYNLLRSADVGPMWALSWVITAFAHSVEDINVVTRLFDAIIANHPIMPVYLSVALVLRPQTRRLLFRSMKDDLSMATAHHFLQNIAPPSIVSADVERGEKARSRKQSRWKNNQVASVDGFVRGQRVPESREEEEENCVDLLVQHSIGMMSVFRPETAIAELQEVSGEMLPKPSVLHVPLSQKSFWAENIASASTDLPFLKDFNDNKRSKLRKQRTVYFAMATAVGLSAYMAWALRHRVSLLTS